MQGRARLLECAASNRRADQTLANLPRGPTALDSRIAE
jgi:hypothetical protein